MRLEEEGLAALPREPQETTENVDLAGKPGLYRASALVFHLFALNSLPGKPTIACERVLARARPGQERISR